MDTHTKAALPFGMVPFGLILYAVLAPAPTIAAGLDCSTYDVVLAQDRGAGADPLEIAADRLPKVVVDLEVLTGDDYRDVSRGFLVMLPDVLLFGLARQDGCLYAPIVIARPNADVGA